MTYRKESMSLADQIVSHVHNIEQTTRTVEWDDLDERFGHDYTPEEITSAVEDDPRLENEDVFVMSPERAKQDRPAPIIRD